MTKPEPFLLQPAGKDYLWGGNRLHTLFGKQLPLHPLAETWECSTHPDGCSIVASGIDKGKTLAEVLQQHPEFLGTKTSATGDLPVLIKLIDAAKDLSVQVHPDDAYAQQYEHEPNGKTEMWYILEAEPGSGYKLLVWPACFIDYRNRRLQRIGGRQPLHQLRNLSNG